MTEEHELRDLVSRAGSGDVGAFERLYQRHQAGIYTFILSQVRNRELAADLAQDTFVRAWESLPRLRQAGAFRGWLHQIAANLVRDEVKSGRARLEVTESVLATDTDPPVLESVARDPSGPDDRVVLAETRDLIWQALGELPAEQRTAVVMHHMEGMSVNEIARVARVRPGTIMSRLARAREALRKRLAPVVEANDEPV
jgi:RNA polymerase sigma-70 factor (ECF subfamily)